MNTEIKLALIRVLPFAAILLIPLFFLKKGRITRQELFINKPSSNNRFFYWVIGFIVLSLIVEFIFYKAGILEITKWNHSLVPSLILIVGAVILAPIAEELIFRGLLLNMLIKRKLNMHLAIFIQASLFVLLHNFTYQHSMASNIAIVQSLLDAMLFGYAKYHSRSIYTPIAMHISGNSIATFERFVF